MHLQELLTQLDTAIVIRPTLHGLAVSFLARPRTGSPGHQRVLALANRVPATDWQESYDFPIALLHSSHRSADPQRVAF